MTAATPKLESIPDLYALELVDGIKAERGGQPIHYKSVRLRDTSVAHERQALQMSERVVFVAGQPKLLASDGDFRYALTLMHIESIKCGDLTLDGPLLDLDLLGKLSPHDLGLIESRVFIIEMALQVRYGLMTADEFTEAFEPKAKTDKADKPAAPQPVGQAAAVGQAPAASQSGPAMLANYAGQPADGAAAGDVRAD